MDNMSDHEGTHEGTFEYTPNIGNIGNIGSIGSIGSPWIPWIPWVTNDYIISTSSDMIENMECPGTSDNSEISEILKIKEELISELINTVPDKEDIDISSIEEKVQDFSEKLNKLLTNFKEQQGITLKAEKDYKDSYDKLQIDTNKIEDFSEFVVKLDTKYKDFEAVSVNKTILEISKKIRENSECGQLKKEYHKQNNIYKYYLHKLIKPLNGINLGSTCNLCLQRQVDTYLQPCGHTGCSECIKKLKDRMGEYNCNCFMCRKKVISFCPLYFT